MPGKTRDDGGSPAVRDLPAPGYPPSEEAVDNWFRKQHGRAPSEFELGAILAAMTQREAKPPAAGPGSQPEQWVTGPAQPPARAQ